MEKKSKKKLRSIISLDLVLVLFTTFSDEIKGWFLAVKFIETSTIFSVYRFAVYWPFRRNIIHSFGQ